MNLIPRLLRRRACLTLGVVGSAALVVSLTGLPAAATVTDTTYQGYPIHNLSLPVATSSGATAGTLNMHVFVRDTDVDTWTDATSVAVPAGDFRVTECVRYLPGATATDAPCTGSDFNSNVPGTVSLPSLETRAIRPLSAGLQVQGAINVQFINPDGSLTCCYANSWVTGTESTINVDPMGAAQSQVLGSNVLLFQPGTTLTSISADLDSLQATGAKMVRTSFPWPLLQPTPNPTFDSGTVSTINSFLKMARARNLKVLAIFGGTPCWASSAPSSVIAAGCPGGAYPPSSQSTLAAAAKQFASLFGKQLAGVELENEPNNSTFWVGTPAQYAQDVKTEYAAMKPVAPGLTVVVGSLAFSDTDWLQQAYAAGLAGNFDAVSVHPYNIRFDSAFTGTGDPMTAWPIPYAKNSTGLGLPWIHWVMANNGDANKPIWVTEFGFSDCTAASALCVSDSNQATYTAETFQLLARLPYVPVVLNYNVRDVVNNPSDWNYNFGFTRYDRSAKPLMTTLTQTFACLAATTC